MIFFQEGGYFPRFFGDSAGFRLPYPGFGAPPESHAYVFQPVSLRPLYVGRRISNHDCVLFFHAEFFQDERDFLDLAAFLLPSDNEFEMFFQPRFPQALSNQTVGSGGYYRKNESLRPEFFQNPADALKRLGLAVVEK